MDVRTIELEQTQEEKRELRKNQAIEEFQDYMKDSINHLIIEFNYMARNNCVNRNELKEILFEDIKEMI